MTQLTTHHDTEVAPELAPLSLPDKPDGPAAAAMMAAGIGILVLGLFTVLAEVSTGIHDFLEAMDFDQGVGPLAGKTILAVIAFFGSWIALHYAWRDRDVDLKRIFWWALVIGVVGAILMFPPVFTAFA